MSNVSVLIIEDEGVVAHDIARRLRKLGYDVAGIKTSSDQALDFLSIHTPDLVLCDIIIDGPKDGIEVAKEVFQHKKYTLNFPDGLIR